MATSFTLAFVLRIFIAAPAPRPPAPTRATRSTSLPAACALRARPSPPAVAAAPARADRFRKSRRDAAGFWFIGRFLRVVGGAGWEAASCENRLNPPPGIMPPRRWERKLEESTPVVHPQPIAGIIGRVRNSFLRSISPN